MADSVYTADLFGSPTDAALPALASDNSHSRNFDGAALPGPISTPQPLLPLAELDLAHDFAIEQHSPATRRAYRSDFALFALWCTARGLNACPAAPETICAFIADEASSGTRVATITRRIAAIRYAHALKGIDPLPTSSEAVRATMKGIRRTRGAAQARKAPATHGIIADMIACCPDTLRGSRDRALLLLGFAGAFRRSELAALTVADLEPNEAGLRVTVRRSKTDQEGKGQTVAILAGTRLKPVDAVSTWLETAGITDGALFRAIDRHGNVLPDPLSTRSIAEIVKKYAMRIGLDADQFSAHSLRAGFITSAAKSGAGLFKIMDVSRHRSVETVRGYVRDAEMFKDHAGQDFL
jgi:site-specific recombinase XerD